MSCRVEAEDQCPLSCVAELVEECERGCYDLQDGDAGCCYVPELPCPTDVETGDLFCSGPDLYQCISSMSIVCADTWSGDLYEDCVQGCADPSDGQAYCIP